MRNIIKMITINTEPMTKARTNAPAIKPKLVIVEDTITMDEVNKALINENFTKCVRGYHLINNSPIKEAVWEDINSTVFMRSGIEVFSKSDGSHLSGMDINSALGRISNKSAKYSSGKTHFDISSYRLTTVCSENSCGTVEDIITEINGRKNFDFYSIIIRKEEGSQSTIPIIEYDWLLIPSTHPVLSPASYEWSPSIGKRGKKKDSQVGWHTNTINGCSMKIEFAMSSQLWMMIEMTEELKQYIIANVTIVADSKYNYIDLHDKLA
jgi:hypothetical protein